MIHGLAHFAFAFLYRILVTAEASLLKRSLAEMAAGMEATPEPLAKQTQTIIEVPCSSDSQSSQPAGLRQAALVS